MRYLVRCRVCIAAASLSALIIGPERDVNYSTGRACTLEDLAAGEWEHPLQVIEFNSVEHICSDVSEDFAIEIASRAINEGDHTLGQRAYDFCELTRRPQKSCAGSASADPEYAVNFIGENDVRRDQT